MCKGVQHLGGGATPPCLHDMTSLLYDVLVVQLLQENPSPPQPYCTGFRVVNALPPDTRVSSISTGAAGEAAAVPEESADSATTAEAGTKPEMMDTAGTAPPAVPPPAAAGGGSSWTAF